jgi:hypothetical protein
VFLLYESLLWINLNIIGLNIHAQSVLVLIWVVVIFKIISVMSVLEDQWLSHLKDYIVLMILWWWLQSSWMIRVHFYLSQCLRCECMIALSSGLIALLGIHSKSVLIFIRVVLIYQVISILIFGVSPILINEWLLHL